MSAEMDELRKQIQHPFIRERRAAIVQLAERLQVPEDHDEVVILLKMVVDEDPIGNMQKLASSILEYDTAAEKAKSKPERQHIFAVSCHNCQRICYFDKREVVHKRPVHMGEADLLDELILDCIHCGKPLVVKINLEGYK
jgi:hypothetical protein